MVNEMKNTWNYTQLILIFAIMTVAIGLGRMASPEAATVTGESQKLGGGLVHVYADLKADGSPIEIGIAFDENA